MLVFRECMFRFKFFGLCLLFATDRFWCLSHSANYKARRQFVGEIFQNFQEAHVWNNSSTGTCCNRFASHSCKHRIYNNLLEARNLLSFLYAAIAVFSLVCSSALTEADDTSSALPSEKLYSETADAKLQKFGDSLVQHIFSSKKMKRSTAGRIGMANCLGDSGAKRNSCDRFFSRNVAQRWAANQMGITRNGRVSTVRLIPPENGNGMKKILIIVLSWVKMNTLVTVVSSQIILIDEAFAPLDPASKQLVQQKLKDLGMQCHICLALTWENGPIWLKCFEWVEP